VTGSSGILIATRSAGKVRELRELFADRGLAVVGLDAVGVAETTTEDALESADTFEANALAKARYFHNLTGLPTVADDSGIEVAALGGAPGVRSKRWSERPDLSGQALDDANNAMLLARLGDEPHRAARYVCAAAYCDSRREIVERGETRGVITREARGRGGFGYDPYFESRELPGGRTFGEVSREEKARVSHRARAFRRLLARLAEEP
jgi:XTP/dITP diphosphohydrolase